MENKGIGLQVLINDCNTIIVTEEAKQEALQHFLDEYNKPITIKEPVIYISEQSHKLLEEYYTQYNNHEKQIKKYWEKKKREEFKKELDLKNSLYVPTEADIRLMHENLLITKPKDEE